MTNLEKNNIDTQIELMNDIIDNYGHITYSVASKGKDLMNTIQKAKYDHDSTSYILSAEDFKIIKDIAYILKDENEFHKLGLLAETAVPNNKLKKEILSMLQK